MKIIPTIVLCSPGNTVSHRKFCCVSREYLKRRGKKTVVSSAALQVESLLGWWSGWFICKAGLFVSRVQTFGCFHCSSLWCANIRRDTRGQTFPQSPKELPSPEAKGREPEEGGSKERASAGTRRPVTLNWKPAPSQPGHSGSKGGLWPWGADRVLLP